MPIRPQSVFGVRLRAARLQAGIPQDRLGVMIGLDEGSSSARISRYESGTHAAPYEIAAKLASALKIPLPYLYCPDDHLADLLLEVHGFTRPELDRLREAAKRIRRSRA